MKRLEDWPERLAAYVDAHRDTPFRWGQNDCATFAAGAVEVRSVVRGADVFDRKADDYEIGTV